MSNFIRSAREFIEREDAPTTAEYGLLVALIAIAVVIVTAMLDTKDSMLLTTVGGSD